MFKDKIAWGHKHS